MWCRFFFLGLCLALLVANQINAQETSGHWKAFEDARDARLPQTAIQALRPIIKRAMENQQHDEAIKAISLRVLMETEIQGNKPAEAIKRMRAEITAAPEPMKPVMHAILANWFWNYFQQNRWRFMQRTEIATRPELENANRENSDDDFETWDLSKIIDAIDQQFDSALAQPQTLQAIPVNQYGRLLNKGNLPDAYRPTLYDILAFNAIDFYSAGEQAGSKRQDAFELSADSPVFATVDKFLPWQPDTAGDDSRTLKAIGLYQDILRFHQNDIDPSALLDADLLRLQFASNMAQGENKNNRYESALRKFADDHNDHPVASLALHLLAAHVDESGDRKQAHAIATEGLKLHPDSVGANRCFNLIGTIESPSASTTTERIWSDDRQTIDVRYKNLTQVYFRLIPFDLAQMLDKKKWPSYQGNLPELLDQQPIKSWSALLLRTDDYRERTARLPIPQDVAPGSYILATSFNSDFSEDDNQVSFCEVWKSSLSLVVRHQPDQKSNDGFVLDAKTGKPIANVPIRVWYQRSALFIEGKPLRTDRDGRFVIEGSSRHLPSVLLASSGDQSVATPGPVYLYSRRHRSKTNEQTRFFTDRSLYRPGQTIHYKGISFFVNQNRDNYRVISGQAVTVALFDANGKEVERVEHRTNEYGSFSGSVMAPRDRLAGQMSLQVVDGPRGSTRFSVEEYKRPKFRVELSPPAESVKLDGVVKVPGKAAAYTGASINDAKVTWRVVRRVRYPDWWWWRCWWMPRTNPSQEIAHGTTTTAADGSFEIEFTANPDRSVARDSEPTFRFEVYVDVTDTTGETRSDQYTVAAGYTALTASIVTDDWLTSSQPVPLRIKTTTLGGQGQIAKGKLSVYAVEQPDQVARPVLAPPAAVWNRQEKPPVDPANPDSWPLGKSVFESDFQTDAAGLGTLQAELPAGIYRAKLQTTDRFGKPVTAELPLQVVDPKAKRFALKLPAVLRSPRTTVQPGETFTALWGSGYDNAIAYIEVIHRGKRLQSYWTTPQSNQKWIKQKVTEAMRGGFTVRTTMVHDNRLHSSSQRVEVPWTTKKLSVQWQHFTSKLQPATKETWKAIIRGPKDKNAKNAQPAVAEMVAAMYDASLDAYRSHSWPSGFGVFRSDYDSLSNHFSNQATREGRLYRNWEKATRPSTIRYGRLPEEITGGGGIRLRRSRVFGFQGGMGRDDFAMQTLAVPAAMTAPGDASLGRGAQSRLVDGDRAEEADVDSSRKDSKAKSAKSIDLSGVSARKNLRETAFFFPHLISNRDGSVAIEFEMPESLTQWKFMGFAHDRELRTGLLADTAVTSKDLMVQPNPPRFLRAGDQIEFTVKVSNQSATHQSGTVRLTFADARTLDNVDQRLGNRDNDRSFDLAAGSSMSTAWRLSVPEGIGCLTYKAVGSTGQISDGEEGYLPVLSKRILVTESLSLPIRGKQTKKFQLKKLIESAKSDSIKHHAVTLQMVSSPSWYAVLGLPYLMEYPHECNEQTFSRLYANALAGHIVGADPKIQRVFDQWKMQPATSNSAAGSPLDSPLEKNQDLKAVMIEETPWLRDADSESEARRRVAVLFDNNRLIDETSRALFKLSQAQLPSGAWSWFPGGRPNDYITLYIATGFGRLRHLGVNVDMAAAIKSLSRLDAWATKRYNLINPEDRDGNHLTTVLAMYLYGRSFFLNDQKIAPEHAEANRYWIDQAKQYWTNLPRQSQAHLAIALKRSGQIDSAMAIMASLRERSLSDEELGMFWRDTEASWWWYRAPIETQAVMIEAFDEVADDQQAVEACKVWLLKQKQAQHWPTTKATADAVYALLLRGTDLLVSDSLVEVSLGEQIIEPENIELGTGMFEKRFSGDQITPKMGDVTVKKTDDGVAWGSVHWQYLESIDKITVHDGTPLKLSKKLFTKKNTASGPVLSPVNGPVEVGDELVVRIELRCDRAMEFVHLKDHRGSGTEPVNVLSRYRYQDGLAYYESTRDTASHFFIDYLPKGTYVFEYSSRVQLRGEYETGLANIQCMYAPQFNSHSESVAIEVR